MNLEVNLLWWKWSIMVRVVVGNIIIEILIIHAFSQNNIPPKHIPQPSKQYHEQNEACNEEHNVYRLVIPPIVIKPTTIFLIENDSWITIIY